AFLSPRRKGGRISAQWRPPLTTGGPNGSCSRIRPQGASGRAPVPPLVLVYDISHNLAKIETHTVDGQSRRLCVHRKGATRALPPGHRDLPPDLRLVGQPGRIPGAS